MSSTVLRSVVLVAVAGFSINGGNSAFAAWPETPEQQIVVNTGTNLIDIGSVPDGAGGVIVVYQDNGVGPGRDIYARRYNINGDLVWPGGTITVSNAPADQSNVFVVPGENGGCFVMWTDRQSGNADIYVQKITADGQSIFSPNGSPFVLEGGHQVLEYAISDGFGGFILAYSDGLLWARRYNPTGLALWGSVVNISAYAGDEISDMISDGAGGCVVGLERAGFDGEVVVMKISPTGGTDYDQLLSDNLSGVQSNIKLALRPNGHVLAVWFDGGVTPSRLVANEFVHPLSFNAKVPLPTGPGSVGSEFELIPSNFGDPILVYGFNSSGSFYGSKLARVTPAGQLTMDTFLLGYGTSQYPDNVMESPTGEIRATYFDSATDTDRKLVTSGFLANGQYEWTLAITPANSAFKLTGKARLISGSQNSMIVFTDQVIVPAANTHALIRLRANGTIGGEVFGPDLKYDPSSITPLRKSKKLSLFGDVLIRNTGTVPTAPTNVAFYASQTPGLASVGVAFLFELPIPALQPGEQTVLTPGQLPPKKPGKKPKARKIKLPKDAKKVPYHLVIGLDSPNTNLELDENNNFYILGPL